jgi:hypothetical protein
MEKQKLVHEILRSNRELQTKNEEITFLEKLYEKENEKKKRMLSQIRTKITPFIAEVINFAEERMEQENDWRIPGITDKLKTSSLEIIEMLKEIETMLAEVKILS